MVTAGVNRDCRKRAGGSRMAVGGVGRGASAALYALGDAEARGDDHETELFFSCNGTAPTGGEAPSPPMVPLKLGMVSLDFAGEPVDAPEGGYDDTRAVGRTTAEGPLIPEELGTWLLDQLPE